jgi:hypothetical protein
MLKLLKITMICALAGAPRRSVTFNCKANNYGFRMSRSAQARLARGPLRHRCEAALRR